MRKLIPNNKKTTLKPDELARVDGLAGDAQAARYGSDGKLVGAKTLRGLLKAKKKARKYVLYSDLLGRRVYIWDNSKTTDTPLTFEIDQALQFYEGFDDPEKKSANWQRVLKEKTGIDFPLLATKIYGKKKVTQQ